MCLGLLSQYRCCCGVLISLSGTGMYMKQLEAHDQGRYGQQRRKCGVLWWAGCWFVSWLVVTNIQVTNNKLLLLAWQ